jgi:hypothetical protein
VRRKITAAHLINWRARFPGTRVAQQHTMVAIQVDVACVRTSKAPSARAQFSTRLTPSRF